MPVVSARSVASLFFITLLISGPSLGATEDDPEISDRFSLSEKDEEVTLYKSIGIGIGLGGIGLDFTYPVNRFFGLRLGYDFGTLKFGFEEDADSENPNAEPTDYDVELEFSSARLLIDYKPFGGSFRISAGYYTGTPELGVSAAGFIEEIELSEATYNIDGNLDGQANMGGGAPYIGIGFGADARKRGFAFSSDYGVLFAKSPSITLTATGRACDSTDDFECDPNGPNGFDISNSVFQSDLDLQRQELEDDAKDFDFFPIVRMSIVYRF